MNNAAKILRLLGGIFMAISGVFLIICLVLLIVSRGASWGLFAIATIIGVFFIFAAVGVFLFFLSYLGDLKHDRILKHGERYSGKIYSYVEDTSISINKQFPMNIVVRYFDRDGIVRETVIPTKFVRGSGEFPIGATIDFAIYQTSSTWIKDSVRYDPLPREDELMDNKPLDPKKLSMVAVNCPTCGMNYTAAKGYVATCPYCGHSVNN